MISISNPSAEVQPDPRHVEKMAPTTESANAKKGKITEKVVALAVTLAEDESACDGVDARRGGSSKGNDILRDGNSQNKPSFRCWERRSLRSKVDASCHFRNAP